LLRALSYPATAALENAGKASRAGALAAKTR
jgi:hypothetical protein